MIEKYINRINHDAKRCYRLMYDFSDKEQRARKHGELTRTCKW